VRIQPVTCAFVLFEVLDVRVDEDVGVDEDHRRPSPSASDNVS
jgi:hypothetical protein